jgi:hypothetical protein
VSVSAIERPSPLAAPVTTQDRFTALIVRDRTEVAPEL